MPQRDCYLTMKVAKDATNFGAATEHFLGEEGAFNVPAIRRRLGTSRQFVLRCSMTSPTRIDVLGMAVQVTREG